MALGNKLTKHFAQRAWSKDALGGRGVEPIVAIRHESGRGGLDVSYSRSSTASLAPGTEA